MKRIDYVTLEIEYAPAEDTTEGPYLWSLGVNKQFVATGYARDPRLAMLSALNDLNGMYPSGKPHSDKVE